MFRNNDRVTKFVGNDIQTYRFYYTSISMSFHDSLLTQTTFTYSYNFSFVFLCNSNKLLKIVTWVLAILFKFTATSGMTANSAVKRFYRRQKTM